MLKYNDLLGKSFELGVQDCFQLCRDFYLNNFGIEIPNISRPQDWEADTYDLIGNHYQLSGFEKIDSEEPRWPPRTGDVLVTTIGGSIPNHLVIYVGDNKIIHHRRFGLSSEEPLKPIWRRVTSYILRHPSVPVDLDTKPKIHLKDILDAKFI